MEKTKRIACFSDTHGKEKGLIFPDNIDIAIFAGDAGTFRSPSMNEKGILDFIDWYAAVPNIKHKIWVAGNHDTSIESGLVNAKQLSESKGLIYLEHESCEIEGFKIFGSPYTPSFGYGWAYNVPRGSLSTYWDEIPLDTDILITHGPVFGLLDFVIYDGQFVGCKELLDVVSTKLSKLQLSVVGHIHCSYGTARQNNITFVNASVVNEAYELANQPILVEL